MIAYRAVGLGMAAFARLKLRVEVQGRLELAPGSLYVVTHRSNLDSPLLCGAVYPQVRGGSADDLPWFVVRDDLFLPGLLAAALPGRAPLSLGIGRLLERVRCLRLRPATRLRVVELARADPSLELDALPNADAFRHRARMLGERPPRTAGDVLGSNYGRELWQLVDRSEAPRPEAAWVRRAAAARQDLERLIGLMREGASMLVSPEGTPSKDGSVGPVQRGVGLIIRRGRPQRVVPIGLAFDPVGGRRTRGVVRIGEPVEPPTRDVEAELRTLLCRTLPRTRGARLAWEYRQGRRSTLPPLAPELVDRLAKEYESALVR